METSADKNDPLAPRRNETPEEDAALFDKVLRPGSRLEPRRPVAAEDIPFRALGFMLSSLGHAVSKRFSLSLGPLDLEPREFALLRRVGLHEGSSQQLMGERLGIPASRIVALVDHLEGRGLLERRPSPTDRRAHALHLTPAGRRLLAKALDIAGAFEGELTQRLTDAQRAQLLEMLDAIATQLGIPSGVHGSQIHH